MIRKIGCSCIQLVDSLLLQLNINLFDLKLGHRVNFLNIEISRHAKFVLSVVLFCFFDIERAIHDFDVDFKACGLLFEI